MTLNKIHKIVTITTDCSGMYFLQYGGNPDKQWIIFADNFETALIALMQMAEDFNEEYFIKTKYNLSDEEYLDYKGEDDE